jgi:hypothetical protein
MGRRQAKQARCLRTAFSTCIGHTGITMTLFLILKNFSNNLHELYKTLMKFQREGRHQFDRYSQGGEPTNQSSVPLSKPCPDWLIRILCAEPPGSPGFLEDDDKTAVYTSSDDSIRLSCKDVGVAAKPSPGHPP